MDDGYLAQVMLFAGNFAPRNWAFCDGRILQINPNTALFSLLGTMYGGDGKSSFALPDLREKDESGTPHLGYQIGKPSWIICTNGMYPTRD